MEAGIVSQGLVWRLCRVFWMARPREFVEVLYFVRQVGNIGNGGYPEKLGKP